MLRGVYPGSFDPITNGHVDIIDRALRIVDELVVAVAHHPSKSSLFSVEERIQILREVLKDRPRVTVTSFEGLLVDFVQGQQAHLIVRGLRALSDFEYEFQLAAMNRKLQKDTETIFLMTSHEYTFLSSSSIKEVAALGGSVRGLVPPVVEEHLRARFGR